jgi:Tol biopolymer transport system component
MEDSMRHRFSVVAMALTISGTLVLAQGARSPEALFKAAQHSEEVQGDLRAAIEQYQKVVTAGNRSLAAQALLRMAECHQKLGDQEARQILTRIVREFGDQPVAAEARTRLNATAKPTVRSDAIAMKKVWVGDLEGTTTADGRWLSYVNPANGNLALHDLLNGTDRPVTADGSWYGDFAGRSALARDGSQIAYTWFNAKGNRYEMRLAALGGKTPSDPRTLFDSDDVVYIEPFDWSSDSKWLAVSLQRADRSAQIGVLSVADGHLKVLKSVDWRGPSKMFFSPDGAYLAFDLPVSDTVTQRDVFVLAVDGSREVAAVVHPARDSVAGWSPDGTRLLFASDRNGAIGLWALPFASGRPSGPPQLLHANLGENTSLGVSTNGTLYVGMPAGTRDIEVATVDLATGKRAAPTVKPISTFVGTNRWLDWSRDGKNLVYVSERGRNGGETVVAIRNAATGDLVREFVPKLQYLQSLSWAPDGTSFAVSGADFKGRRGIFRIDAQTGEVTAIVVSNDGLTSAGSRPEWAPDGKHVYFSRFVGKGGRAPAAIIEREIVSGVEREVIRRADPGTINVSPDGRWIASGALDTVDDSQALLLIPTAGGVPRELIHATAGATFTRNIGWTPDGRGIVVRKQLDLSGKTSELWFVPIDGGQPVKLDVDVNRMGPLSPIRVHPDGRRLAFFSFLEQTGNEVWTLENFLPALTAKK